jgi:dihydrofolate reductase
MRKLIVFNLITLDGYFAGVDGNIDWHNVDQEFNDFAVKQTAEFGTIIFGKTTYEMFADFWPKALKDPEMSPEDHQIAQIIQDVEKIVFSKSLDDVTWNNSKLLGAINPEDVKRWKQEEGKDMVIFGSGTIVQQMTNLGLVDEYRLLLNPIILGEGKPLFANVEMMHSLKLRDTRTFKNGNVLLTYSS